MEDVPQSPVEAIEQTPVEPERFLDIVIRVCEQHQISTQGETVPAGGAESEEVVAMTTKCANPSCTQTIPLFSQWKDLSD